MTELEAKAKDCIENHTHKLVDKPTKQDIYLREESIFISGYNLAVTEILKQWKKCFLSCSSPYCAEYFREIKISGENGRCEKEIIKCPEENIQRMS